jgi:hypothetical protein
MSDERKDRKALPATRTATSRRDALKRMAELGCLVSAPAALIGCSDGASYSSNSYYSCTTSSCYSSGYSSEGYSSGGYSSGYSSGGYSSSGYSSSSYSSSKYSSSYSSQTCNGYGSLYYYSYRCTYS